MSKRRGKAHHEEEASEAWLLPYSDLMTLLLAVFIVLFAVSKTDEIKSQSMAQAFQNIIMPGGSGILNQGNSIIQEIIQNNPNTTTGTNPNSNGNALTQADLAKLEQLQSNLKTYFHDEGLDSAIQMQIDERGLVISVENSILFDSGSAYIKTENIGALTKIADTIRNVDNYIRVEGHTDNLAISTPIYPSNWELSAARAASVIRLFITEANIAPEKMVAVGYAEFKPKADNATAEGRAENRRVDIIVLNARYDSLENH